MESVCVNVLVYIVFVVVPNCISSYDYLSVVHNVTASINVSMSFMANS